MRKPIRQHAATVLALSAIFLGSAQAATIAYLGQQHLPTGFSFNNTTVGGLSGIDRDPSTGRYLAISDDRSGINPARFYDFSLNLNQFVRSANPGSSGVSFNSVTTILQPNGNAFASNTLDPESLRINPANGRLVWTNEGQRGGAGVPALQNPTVREMTTSGAFTRDFSVPSRYFPVGSNAGDQPGDRGIRNNLAFESLSFSVDGNTLYTATENALVQDGPASGVGVSSPARILSFNAATGQAGAEYVYAVAAVALPPVPGNAFATNGLVELLAIADGQFLAIERSFSAGAVTPGVGPNGLPTGNSIRLFHVDTRNATNVAGIDSLKGQAYTPVSKTLLLDLSTLLNDDGSALALDNIEAITWGPNFNGNRTLILASDNNFSSTQFTQFVALTVSGTIPVPGSLALALSSLALLAWRARRQAD